MRVIRPPDDAVSGEHDRHSRHHLTTPHLTLSLTPHLTLSPTPHLTLSPTPHLTPYLILLPVHVKNVCSSSFPLPSPPSLPSLSPPSPLPPLPLPSLPSLPPSLPPSPPSSSKSLAVVKTPLIPLWRGTLPYQAPLTSVVTTRVRGCGQRDHRAVTSP